MTIDFQNPIVCFAGTTPNIGTTCISFGIALHAARLSDSSIGYLCLNLKSSKLHRYLGIDHPSITLDRLRVELKAGTLNEQRLLHSCDKIRGMPNLHILYGNMLRDQAEYYQAEDIEYLLSVAAKTFDLCIVEVNAYWDNAATVCAMLNADEKIVVTTPELSHFQEDTNQWLKNIGPEFNLDTKGIHLYLSQYSSGRGFRAKDICKETGMNVIGSLPNFAELSMMLDQGKLKDFLLEKEAASLELVKTVKYLFEKYRIVQKSADVKSKRLPYRLFGFGFNHSK